MWKNIVDQDKLQILWRMRIACWISKATNTQSDYVKFIAVPLQQWLHEHFQCYVICTLLALLELIAPSKYTAFPESPIPILKVDHMITKAAINMHF
jgi:hypothetical protein